MPKPLAKPLSLSGGQQVVEAFRSLDVHPRGIDLMKDKARVLLVALYGISPAVANMLKQDMLSLGGDLAVPRDTVSCKKKLVDGILMGHRKVYRQLLVKLDDQDYPLREDLQKALAAILDPPSPRRWPVGGSRELALGGSPRLMGILNLTPDSFYDGGLHGDTRQALEHAARMAEEGAEIIDLGGESTRPGAATVSESQEMDRVIPVIEALARELPGMLLSIDTYKARVAQAALDAGAHIVNDIGAGILDPRMLQVVASSGAGYVMMHMRGEPRTMQKDTRYEDLLAEIYAFFENCLERAAGAGIDPVKIVLDPGIGFGKPPVGNYELISRLGEFAPLGRPLLVGPSRKSFMAEAGQKDPAERLEGTLAACTVATLAGAELLRVHDVAQVRRAVEVAARFPLPADIA